MPEPTAPNPDTAPSPDAPFDAARAKGSATDEDHAGFFGAVRTVAGLTLVSRFAGLARDVVQARIFGDTAVASAFAFAFLIPNLFRRLFGEGALTAAFLPEYARLLREDRPLADRFVSLTITLLVLALGVITLVGETILLVVLLLAPGDEDRRLMLTLAMVLLPYMPLVCGVAIIGAALQTHGRFAPVAAAPVLLNACIVAGALLGYIALDLPLPQTAMLVSIAVVFSGIVQVAWAMWSLRGRVRWTRTFTGAGNSARVMIRRFIPGVIGLGTLQLNALLDGVIAGWPVLVGPTILGVAYPLDEASLAVLTYSQRLYQFPLGVFGIAVATAVFPLLARVASDGERFTDTLRRGLRLSLFIGVPASVGLILVRTDAAYVLFRGENFSDEGVRRAAAVLLGYAGAVWAYSANHTLIRGFYARGDTATPVRVAVAAMLLNLAGNLTLIWMFDLREAALAWSTAISATAQFVALTVLARRDLAQGAPIFDAATRAAAMRTLAASLLMGVAVAGAIWLLPEAQTWPASFLRLLVAIFVGGAVYAGLAALLRRDELRWLLSRSASRA